MTFFCCAPDLLQAQEIVRFQRLSVPEGLSQVMANTLLEDTQGFIWIGTRDGLNQFDGYQFNIYRRDVASPDGSLSDGFITRMAKDGKGRIWIGTRSGGLNVFDPVRRSFKPISYQTNDTGTRVSLDITGLHCASDGVLWAATLNRVFTVDPETEAVNDIALPRGFGDAGRRRVQVIGQDAQGHIWAGGNNVLLKTRTTAPNSPMVSVPIDGLSEGFRVSSLLRTPEGDMLFGTTRGLYRYDPTQNRLTRPWPELNQWVRRIFIYQDQLWIALNQSLVVLDQTTGALRTVRAMTPSGDTLSDIRVNHALVDRNNLLWLGTNNGLLMHNPHRRFETIDKNMGLRDNIIYGLEEGNDGEVFIGAYNGDVYRYTPNSDQVNVLVTPNIQRGAVTVLRKDRNHLYIGTLGGLLRFDLETQALVNLSLQPWWGQANRRIFYVYLDPYDTDHIWISTGGGLFQLSKSQNRLTRVDRRSQTDLPVQRIRLTYRDRTQRLLWVGSSGGGLSYINLESGNQRRFIHRADDPTSLSHNDILCISETTESGGQTLWIGTRGGGLNALDPSEGRFRRFTTREGLPNDTVYAALEDPSGFLWLSTNNGIARMDPTREHIVKYDTDSGLPGLEFNTGSYLQTRDHRIFFGGMNGAIWFHPRDMDQIQAPPQVLLSDLQINNNPAPIGEDQVLQSHISYADQIVLDHTHTIMKIGFTALDFAAPDLVSYAYRLEPFESTWRSGNASRREATYTNLDPGSYTFRVKAANSDGIWNHEGVSLEIQVKPAPWRSIWAYGAYVLLGLTFLVVYIRTQKYTLERRNTQLKEQVEIHTETLQKKLDELEVFGKIVNAVNEEVDLEKVLDILLREAMPLFPEAERGIFLMRQDDLYYRVVSSHGYNWDVRGMVFRENFLGNLYQRQSSDPEGHIYRDSLVNPEQAAQNNLDIELAQASISAVIVSQGNEIGRFTMVNVHDPEAFNDVDLGLLMRFRDFVLSAIIRTKTTSDLLQAQKQLVRGARRAGMSEVAGHLMHNLGNTLNQVRTGVDLMQEKLHENRAAELLERITENEKTRGALAEINPRGPNVISALGRIAQQIRRKNDTLLAENLEIKQRLDEAAHTLWDQLARITPEPVRQKASLNVLIRKVLDLESSLFQRDNIYVHTNLDQVASVCLDPEPMEQVLCYLFENAREAMTKTHGRRQLDITTWNEDAYVALRIRDNGHGFPKELREKIFFQGFSTQQDKLGLGLHLSILAMNEMGGSLELSSPGEGKGAVVIVRLPVSEDAAGD